MSIGIDGWGARAMANRHLCSLSVWHPEPLCNSSDQRVPAMPIFAPLRYNLGESVHFYALLSVACLPGNAVPLAASARCVPRRAAGTQTPHALWNDTQAAEQHHAFTASQVHVPP